MENKIFEMNISGQKGRNILYIILLAAILVILIALCFVLLLTGIKNSIPLIYDLLRLLMAIFLAAIILSIMLLALQSPRSLRTLEITEDRIIANGQVIYSEKGLSFNFKGGLAALLINTCGFSMIISGRDDKDRPIKKSFWLGPTYNKYCKAKRKELADYIISGTDPRLEKKYLRFREKVKTEPVAGSISIDSITKSQRILFVIIMAAVILFAAVAISMNELVMSVFVAVLALLFLYALINNTISFNANKKDIISKVELSETTLKIDDDTFELSKDMKAAFYCLNHKNAKERSNIEYRKRSRSTEYGYYIEVTEGQDSHRYWLGPSFSADASYINTLIYFTNRLISEKESQ